MAWPCALSRRTSSNSRRASSRPRLLVGSSSTSTRAADGAARARSRPAAASRDERRAGTARRAAISAMAELAPATSRRDRRACALRSNEAEARRLHAEHDVLHDREVRRERELLVDHRHAGAARLQRARAARRARRRASCVPASGASAPARMAISVLLPAPFWPTRAQTSPGATAQVHAVQGRPWRRRPCGCRASRTGGARQVAALGYGFSHSSLTRSGSSSVLHVRLLHVLARGHVHAGVDARLDRLALEVRRPWSSRRGSPSSRVLHHEAVDAGRRRGPSPGCRRRRSRRSGPCPPSRCPAARAAWRRWSTRSGQKMPSIVQAAVRLLVAC